MFSCFTSCCPRLISIMRKSQEYVSGAHGVEGRYPFLDTDVIQEFLWLTPEMKNAIYKAPIHQYMQLKQYPFDYLIKVGFGAKTDLSQVKQGKEHRALRAGADAEFADDAAAGFQDASSSAEDSEFADGAAAGAQNATSTNDNESGYNPNHLEKAGACGYNPNHLEKTELILGPHPRGSKPDFVALFVGESVYQTKSLDIDETTSPSVLWDLNTHPLPFHDEQFDVLHAHRVLEFVGTQVC